MRSNEWIERLAVNAEVATILGSIPAISDTVKSEGLQVNQCWIMYMYKSVGRMICTYLSTVPVFLNVCRKCFFTVFLSVALLLWYRISFSKIFFFHQLCNTWNVLISGFQLWRDLDFPPVCSLLPPPPSPTPPPPTPLSPRTSRAAASTPPSIYSGPQRAQQTPAAEFRTPESSRGQRMLPTSSLQIENVACAYLLQGSGVNWPGGFIWRKKFIYDYSGELRSNIFTYSSLISAAHWHGIGIE